ncbi:MAG: hypothetical protein AAFO82_11905 [Bacteroidota bacterium]
MKNIVLLLLSLPIILGFGGLVKYNLQLNAYIEQETTQHTANSSISNDHKAEVHIIGTVHFETDSIKRYHLYNYLDSIAPSIILYEGDSSSVRKIVNKTDYFDQIINTLKNRKKLEKPVALKYTEHHPECVLLPYEWEKRVKYHRKHRFTKRSNEMLNLVIGLYRDSLLTRPQTAIIEEFLELNRITSKIDNGQITNINNTITDSLIKRRQQDYIYTAIPEIAKDRKELVAYLDFIPIHMNYWDTRNKVMAQNILKQIEHHPNKTIVVLTGFSHRYYLIEELLPYQTEYGFVLNPVDRK